MKTRKLLAAVLALAMALSLCTAASAEGAIKIGVIGPMTGGAAVYGTAVANGAKIAVEEINALGGTITNAFGIPKEQLKEVSKLGIAKINVDTDIRLAVIRNLRELFWYNPELREHETIKPIYDLLQSKTSDFDPRVFLPPIMDTVMYGNVPNEDVARIVEAVEKGVKEAVGTLIVDFDSYGKAPLVEQVTLDEMAERYKKAGI